MIRYCAALALLTGCTGDGDVSTEPVTFVLRLENVSAAGSLVPSSTGVPQDHLFAPGVAVVHADGWSLFEEGSPASDRPGLEALAEDGDNSGLLDALQGEVTEASSFAAKDDVTYADAPMLPGDAAVLTIDAAPGERLTLATMYGESNDIFVALAPGGVALFDDAGEPVEGDLSASLGFYDAGTEVNQEPGTGADQAPRQAAPGTGEAEGATVSAVIGTDKAGFTYPAVATLLALTIEVQPTATE